MIIAVGGWRATGASVSALLLAWCAADDTTAGAWLVEADPSGGVLAGRMQLPAHAIGGLERVAFPQGAQSATDGFVAVAHQPAGCDGRLHLVAAPVDPFRAHSCHQPRAPWQSALRDLPGHVVVDVGSLRAGSPVQPLLDLADAVLVVSSPEVSAAVASSEMLACEGRVSPGTAWFAGRGASTRLVFVDSPGGVSFPPEELEQQLGDQCAGSLPWEPATVDLVQRGAGPHERRLRKSALVSATRRVLDAVLVGAPPADVTVGATP